eukprot:GHVQ01010898.1.p1 GENE.GHVQ01010898.1~~GHVQ01010898.1.p1  ORF type:complete len:138 (+),score=31.23 GHVQ01010898.1:123-536(+)
MCVYVYVQSVMAIYVYMCVCMCVCVCVYMCICTVNLKTNDEISSNLLDDDILLEGCGEGGEDIPNLLDGETLRPLSLDSMPTEEDVINYEQAKQAALARARAIQLEKGIEVSHRRILNDEAVDDYDDHYDDQDSPFS